MRPPIEVLVTRPSAHRTNRISAIVHNIVFLSIDEFLVTSLEYHSRHAKPRVGTALWGVDPNASRTMRNAAGSIGGERHPTMPTSWTWGKHPMVALGSPGLSCLQRSLPSTAGARAMARFRERGRRRRPLINQAMHAFLVHVSDDNFSRVLPKNLDRSKSDNGRVKVMAFPPLGIQTLAPVLRQRGHQVRMFDTCHPQMKAEHIADAVATERPDVVALSFLSTTTYPAVKSMARRLKAKAPTIPIIVGGAFATLNADRILEDCRDIDGVGVGEGEELLPDYLEHLADPGSVAGLVWRRDGQAAAAKPGPVSVSGPDQFAHRLYRVAAPGSSGGAFAGQVLHGADVARLPLLLHLLRYSVPGRRSLAQPFAGACAGRVAGAE
jgi:hypothetical protein